MVRKHGKKRGHTWVNDNPAHKKVVMANQFGQSKDSGRPPVVVESSLRPS
jgi:hypothetical protein